MGDWGQPVYCDECKQTMPLGIAANPRLHECGNSVELELEGAE